MQRHSEIGERILANVDDYGDIARVVRHHHERVDGNGYPDGLTEDEIPLLSRIIAVADAYNAMTSDRPTERRCRAGSHACDLPKRSVPSSTRPSWRPSRRSSQPPTSAYRLAQRADFDFSLRHAEVSDQPIADRGRRLTQRSSCVARSAAAARDLTPSFSKMWRT